MDHHVGSYKREGQRWRHNDPLPLPPSIMGECAVRPECVDKFRFSQCAPGGRDSRGRSAMAIWATWALPSQERSRKHDRFSESSLEFRNFALHCLALEILLMASGGTFRGRCAGASEHIIKIRKDNGFVRKRGNPPFWPPI